MKAAASACVAGWILAGCTLKAINPDAGTVDAATETVGDQCTAIATEFCSQAISRCGQIGFTLSECIMNDLPMCCSGSVCNQTSLSPASDIHACTSAIDVVDCNYIANSTLPPQCQGVPKKPPPPPS